ncbi:hypothetical protein PYW08_009834 [Mythimna loreyi]|uniref:Uncharacterized protein n=1 Tax=Mythimna loreyi TaxID=667449 RepID=A0ACC2QBY9_9NEOP|nr:hypothetical protein PYW08_009834 [Mythimna loreyi]
MKRDKTGPVNIIKTQLDRCITALLKGIRTQVENELLNKSATSSTQVINTKKVVEKLDKPTFPQELSKTGNTSIVTKYETKAESVNSKVNLNLDKQICQPSVSHIGIQTDPDPEFPNLAMSRSIAQEQCNTVNEKPNTSVTSLTKNSERKNNEREITQPKPEDEDTKPTDLGTERTEIEKKRTRSLVNTMTPSLRKSAR